MANNLINPEDLAIIMSLSALLFLALLFVIIIFVIAVIVIVFLLNIISHVVLILP